MPIKLRAAIPDDLFLLAQMNDRLVEDQGSENPFSISDLEDRFKAWLTSDEWKIDVFLESDSIVGYAVYQQRPDYYDQDQTVVYLRQFYIERQHRGRGLGTRAFAQLARERFLEGCEVSLDVVSTNPRGESFWSKLGFVPYFTAMKLKPNHPRA